MNHCESALTAVSDSATVSGNRKLMEAGDIVGRFTCECRDAEGNLKWTDEFDNLITAEGKRYLLDGISAANSYSTVYMGLISSVSYGGTGVAVDDLAADINTTNDWKEAGTGINFPLITGGLRIAPSFGAASGTGAVSKATTATQFTIVTTGGTVKGAIILVNSTSAVGNTTGKLFSCGLFTGGDKAIAVSDTLNVTYTATLN